MSRKDIGFVHMAEGRDGKGTWTLTFTRKNCRECGGSNLNGCNEKLALHYLKGYPEKTAALLELVEVVGLVELWLCRDCKAFGTIPMILD